MSTDGAEDLPLGHTHTDDASLVAGVGSGDERALERLVELYTVPLVRFATGHVHAREAAEEIVEDVFVRVWELGQAWQPKGTVRAYLFAAVRNRASDWRKHTAAEARLHDRWQQEVEADPARRESRQEWETDDESEETVALRRALEGLTERQREALRLRYEERLSYREVAGIMGISESAVDRLLSRAVQALRRTARGGWGKSG